MKDEKRNSLALGLPPLPKTRDGLRQYADCLMRKYWHAVLFLGYLILMPQFALLEKYVVPRYWISCSLDQAIPFLPVFVIPYVLWFPMIAVVLVALCFSDRGDFARTILLLYAGMALAMLICLLFPHGQPLRPIVTENDIFSRMVRYTIYANDTNTNTFPSIHVLNQLAIHIGLCKSKLFRDRKGWKRFSLVMTVLVCASTCFIKQHSILDVAGALLLEIPLYFLVFRVDWSRFVPVRWKERARAWELRGRLSDSSEY